MSNPRLVLRATAAATAATGGVAVEDKTPKGEDHTCPKVAADNVKRNLYVTKKFVRRCLRCLRNLMIKYIWKKGKKYLKKVETTSCTEEYAGNSFWSVLTGGLAVEEKGGKGKVVMVEV